MNIYLISGLGADKRIFQQLSFTSGNQVHHIEWTTPNKEEQLSAYAHRLCEQVDITKPFCLIGVSFGGMIAVEMLQFIKPEKTIIISSVFSKSQLPWYFKLKGLAVLVRHLPSSFLKNSNKVTHWLFGLTDENEKQLFRQIMEDTDPAFMKWAIRQVLLLKRDKQSPSIIHIHGNKDRLLPLPQSGVNYIIKDGGHFMVFNKAGEISAILTTLLKCPEYVNY